MSDPILNPYLYLLIRNDLPSLNAGKAVAHGAHAANQFVFELPDISDPTNDLDRRLEIHRMYSSWANATPIGFGTTITLAVNFRELQSVVQVAKAMGFAAGETVDPSYPYETTNEVAGLINHPVEFPPVYKSNGNAICFRAETTVGYVFGDKDALFPIVGRFPLMP